MSLLSHIHTDDLICLALRHRWVPYAGSADVIVGGARCRQWVLKCETGCGSEAIEWRDLLDVRLPGTTRQYSLTDRYRASLGYSQAEYMGELRRRQGVVSINRTG